MYNINKIRKHFPIYQKYPNLVYFDSSASSLVPREVIKSQNDYYAYNGTNVHRGAYRLSYEATQSYDEARLKVAKFINAEENEIIFTKGTTDGLNLLANLLLKDLKEDEIILTSMLEHHSSILPYFQHNYQFIPLDQQRITLSGIKKVMSEKVKIVAITLGSNTLGYITDIQPIIAYLRQYSCTIILDCAQVVAHQAINVKTLDVDFLAFSAHKIFGPNGVGVLYGKEKLLNKYSPLQYGGEMVEKVFIDHAIYKESPFRHEAGTPNIAGVIGLGAAVDFINHLGLSNIAKHTNYLKDYLLRKMALLNEIEIYSQNNELPIILFNVKEVYPHDIASYLDTYQICVRAGFHCAQLVTNLLNVDWTIRISLGIYNTISDCEIFIQRIKEAIAYFKGN
ncbi:MAG: cysteine desulfurase [Acholeplasmatales bacterium]|jgi:cysteine desulfurase/selenocysteine lyase|nr:cysteine desulfurase [Acholeplasmatales bacterium]